MGLRSLPALLAAAASAAAEGSVFLPIDDVRPGMTATVKTVLHGTEISDMRVEVISVVRKVGPQSDLILARAIGEPLESLGVSQGMSGSPAYVDGKLIGAVSSTWSFAKQPMLGITPVEQMAREADWGPAASGQASAAPERGPQSGAEAAAGLPFGSPRSASALAALKAGAPSAAEAPGFAPIGSPLVLSGFDRRLVSLAAEVFAPWGLTVTEGGVGGHAQEGGAIEPGATMGVRLAGGDADMTAIGTVTWVDGDHVHGWGHPFFQAGQVEFPLVTGYVHGVIPSQAISFKLASGGDVVGTITSDRRSGIAGRLGVKPRLTEMALAVTQRGVTQKFSYQIVRDRNLQPSLAGILTANSMLVREGGIADQTVRFRQRIALVGGRETVLETVFAGDETPGQLVDLLSQATQVIVQNPFEEVAIERIDAEIVCEPGIRIGTLLSATLDDDRPEPGDELHGTYVLKDWRGAQTRHRFRIPLPEDAREGRYLLLVADAASAEQFEAERDPRSYQPRSLDELLQRIRDLKRTDEVHVHLYRQSKGVLLEGRPLPDLPPSALAVFGDAMRSGVAAELPAELAYELRLPAGKFVTGAHTILFEVRKEKP